MNWFKKTFSRQPDAGAAQPVPQPGDSSSPDDISLFGPADALSHQANIFMEENKPAEALTAMNAAIAAMLEVLGRRTDLPARERRLAQLYGLQGSIKVKLGDLDGANQSLLDSWVTYRALSDRFPIDPDLKADVSIALQKIARVLMLQNRHADALKFIQDASKIMAGLMNEWTGEPKYRQYFNAYTELLAECFTALGKPEMAAELLRRS